jgi:hypothetical protein
MSRKDYRVTMRVEFTLNVGADDKANALGAARVITASVFRQSFQRAEHVRIEALRAHLSMVRQT